MKAKILADDQIRDAFFEAMTRGWVGNDPKITTLQDIPGSHLIRVVYGNFEMYDMYFTSPSSDQSHGTTLIHHNGEMVWFMSYEGHYPKRVIPYLRESLKQAYFLEKRFYGGRGPIIFAAKDYTYVNFPERNDFRKFKGREQILDSHQVEIGYHEYRGGLVD